MERRVLNKLKYSLVGAVALAAGVMVPEQVYAQNGNSTEQPTPVIAPVPSFVRPEINQLSQAEKPLIAPIFVPQPIWSEPTDLDYIVAFAAKQMGAPEAYIRKVINCESGFDPRRINPDSGARGWWQFMSVHAQEFVNRGYDYRRDSLNPYRSTIIAIILKNKHGWRPWDCR